jgi:ligand-binding sensor domain-containing protein
LVSDEWVIVGKRYFLERKGIDMKQFLKKTVILLMTFLAGSTLALAQESSWLFYQSGEKIRALISENDYLWIGTNGGPVRLNITSGEKKYYYNQFGADILKSHIYSIAIDSNGTKWFGTAGGLLSLNGDQWTAYDTSNSALPNNGAWALTLDKKNRIWVGTTGVVNLEEAIFGKGVACFDGESWTVFDTSNSDLPANRVEAICADNEFIWMGTLGGGLAAFNDTSWMIYNTSNSGLPSNGILSLAIAPDSSLWIGSFGGLSHFDGESWTTYNTENTIMPHDAVFTLYVDDEGVVWAGCGMTYNGGLVRIDGSEWTLYNKNNSDLATYDVFSVCKDKTDRLWVGALEGLFSLQQSEWSFYKTGLGTGYLRAVTVDMYGKIWLGGEGLYAYDAVRWESFSPSNSPMPHQEIYGLLSDSQNRIWIGTQDGLALYTNSEWQIFNTDNSEIPGNFIHVLKEDHEGNIWVGTNGGGLGCYDGLNWDVYKRTSGLPSNTVNDIAIDNASTVWVATVNGLGVYNGSEWIKLNTTNSGLPSNNLIAVASDNRSGEDEILWIGTNDAGLTCYDRINWTTWNTSNSDIPSDQIQALALDQRGIVWIGTYYGLVSFNGTQFTIHPELENKNIESIYIDEENTKWITVWGEGLAVYNESGLVKIDNISPNLPQKFTLFPNYPNPFNPTTTIRYSLPEASHVTLNIYDITGRLVEQLVNQHTPAGYHTVSWDATSHSSGVYIARLKAGSFVKTQKMVLMK